MLSFSEKRPLQKTVNDSLSTLEGANLPFAAKRTAQKSMNDALDKLDAGSQLVPDPDNPNPFDTQPTATSTIEQVRDAMKDTGMESGWYMNADTNKIINSGVKQGWLLRPSTTQVEWTEEGVALARQLDAPEKQPTIPTVDEVGAVLEARGWKLGGNLDGGAWQLDPSVPAFVGKGSYLVTGVDAGGGNSGWITLDTLQDGVWSGLGRTIDLKNNTAASIVKEIESRIAEKEEQNSEPDAAPQSQKLTDLLSGKYDDLQPEAYLKVVQDIIIEINAVDPVKPALLSYLDKAKAKGLITESAAAAFEAILSK